MKKGKPFSSDERVKWMQEVQKEEFDLVVIGGGITGAGIALDAASRGMKVVLLEKGDFASGTSSKSTKLIHGGLRYLKQFDFWLVKEVGSERAIVHRLAPHLVLPEKMLLPLIEGGSYGKWLTSIGLKVYDILAQVEGEDQRKMVEKKEAKALEPLLPKKILKGAGYYAEYRTDDARLTLENIKTSLDFGAKALNYSEVVGFLYENDQVRGVTVKDLKGEETYSIRSRYVISAAGPWVDELRGMNNSRTGKRLHLTKGVHLVFPYEKLPIKQSVYFDVPDGRMMFAIPRGKVTYIGTTDTHYTEDKEEVTTDLTDATYLIAAVNNMFPSIQLELEDIISSWAGLRPLIFEEGKSASELSRKDEIFVSDSGLISIAGGKLTGYRKMAERTVNRVAKKMEEEHKKKFTPCKTDQIPLKGNEFADADGVQHYIEEWENKLAEQGIEAYQAWYLVTTYGAQTELIWQHYGNRKEPDNEQRLLLAELDFCREFEMVHEPEDFFIRRTARLYFDIDSVRKHLEVVISAFQKTDQLSDEECRALRERMEHQLVQHAHFSTERD